MGRREDFTETCGHCNISPNQASLEGNVAGFTSFYVAEACFTVLCNSERLLCLASSRPSKSDSRYPEEGFWKIKIQCQISVDLPESVNLMMSQSRRQT